VRLAGSFLLLICASVLLSGCWLRGRRAECELHDGQPFHEVTTTHFRVRTNLEPAIARNFAQHIERIRLAHLHFLAGPDFDVSARVDLVALARPEHLEEFTTEVGGFASTLGLRQFIVTTGQAPDRGTGDSYYTLVHEIAHAASFKIIPKQQKWLTEGLAGFLESTRVREDGTAVFGTPVSDRLRRLRDGRLLSMKEVFAWGHGSRWEGSGTLALYDSSWLLVHYLALEHLPRFQRYWMDLATGVDPDALWAEHFPDLTVEVLDQRLRAYRQQPLKAHHYTLKSLPVGDYQMRALSPADVHVLRAQIFHVWTQSEQRRDLAARAAARVANELDRARALDPLNLEADLLSFHRTNDPKEEQRIAARLVRTHPDAAASWWALARSYNEPLPVRREAAARAIALDPSDAAAHNLAARYALEEKRPEDALQHAVASQRLAPWYADSAKLVWLAQMALGRCVEVERDKRHALLLHGRPLDEARRLAAQAAASCRRAVDKKRAPAVVAEP
jgi:hypothetical protein